MEDACTALSVPSARQRQRWAFSAALSAIVRPSFERLLAMSAEDRRALINRVKISARNQSAHVAFDPIYVGI